MDKKTVNQQIINGLASKGINIAEIELNHLEAFADIMYKAINVIQCCKSDSELLQKLEKVKNFEWGIDPTDNERRMCELIMLL